MPSGAYTIGTVHDVVAQEIEEVRRLALEPAPGIETTGISKPRQADL
jgi:hypothetical protein